MALEDAQNSPKSELCLPNLVESHKVTGVTGRRICPSSFKNSCIFFNGIFLGAAQELAGVRSPVEVTLSGKGCQDAPVNPISKIHLSLKMHQNKQNFFLLPKYLIFLASYSHIEEISSAENAPSGIAKQDSVISSG